MQELKSLNFEPLRPVYPDLANMGGHGEHYAYADPESALVKLRNFAERVVDHIYVKLQLPRALNLTLQIFCKTAAFRWLPIRMCWISCISCAG